VSGAFPGIGTLINVIAIVVGSLVGMGAGHRIPQRTRDVVTDCLGLVTLLMAGLSAMEVTNPALVDALPTGSAVLVVLGSVLIGSIVGSLLGIEVWLESLAGRLHARLGRSSSRSAAPDRVRAARERFIEGWLSTSLLFCVGPLAVLGSLSDGMGRGIDQLALKSALDAFAALAFASTLGVGVLFSAVSVGVAQGALTLLGVTVGVLLPTAHVASLTAVGGLLLVGIALRLLRIRQIPVGDMLPSLLVAPLLTTWVAQLA
jgi:uncharacterized membrane protein YqgA involved in biofilm formation